jgi:hypothetical protein
MQLFQILGSAAILSVAAYFAYNAFANMYFQTEYDRRGVAHKRDVRNGRFVRVK